MGSFKIIEGDLFEHIQNFEFDVISHGCNIFCSMGAGIAVPMKQKFGCDAFRLERFEHKGDYNKLGQIDFELKHYNGLMWTKYRNDEDSDEVEHSMYVVNSYTQAHYGHKYGIPLDYDALTLCLRKINKIFPGKRVGLPLIGGKLAGGNPETIIEIMKNELVDCDVTLVLFPENN